MYGQPHRMPMPMPGRPNIPQPNIPQPQYPTAHTSPSPSSFGTGRSSISDADTALNLINYKLKNLSSDQLKELLDDETEQNKIIEGAEQLKQLIQQKETLKARNKQIASENLNSEPQLEAAKTKLFETYHEVPKLQEQYESHKKQIENLSKNFSPETTLAVLKTAAREAEDETEGTINSFLDGDMSIEDFIEKFRKQKMVHHLRKTKADKLEEILRKKSY